MKFNNNLLLLRKIKIEQPTAQKVIQEIFNKTT